MPPCGSVGICVQACHVPTPARDGTTLLSMRLPFHKAAKLTKWHCGHACLCASHVLVFSHGDLCMHLSTCFVSAPLPGAQYTCFFTQCSSTNVWAGLSTGTQSIWFCSTHACTQAVFQCHRMIVLALLFKILWCARPATSWHEHMCLYPCQVLRLRRAA